MIPTTIPYDINDINDNYNNNDDNCNNIDNILPYISDICISVTSY